MTRLFLAALAAFSFAAHAQDHPRLYFDASDLPQLRADTAGARAHIWQNLRGYAEDELGNPPPASSDPGNGLNFFRLGGDKLAAFALVAAITEEERFIQHAKDYMLAYASWEYWGEEEMRDLGHGHMLFGKRRRLRLALSALVGNRADAPPRHPRLVDAQDVRSERRRREKRDVEQLVAPLLRAEPHFDDERNDGRRGVGAQGRSGGGGRVDRAGGGENRADRLHARGNRRRLLARRRRLPRVYDLLLGAVYV